MRLGPRVGGDMPRPSVILSVRSFGEWAPIFCVERAAVPDGAPASIFRGFFTQFRGRLIGRTPAFEAGYHGSSPCPGANFLFVFAPYLGLLGLPSFVTLPFPTCCRLSPSQPWPACSDIRTFFWSSPSPLSGPPHALDSRSGRNITSPTKTPKILRSSSSEYPSQPRKNTAETDVF